MELAQLARTAGVEVVGESAQRLDRVNPATYIGRGKLEELTTAAQYLGVDIAIFDGELSPAQQRNLEAELGVRVIDRTTLILDVFARHARTREGALQVELAQYEYRMPRLTRARSHLAQQAGGSAGRGGAGGVGLRGPGETQLETDRRLIKERISRLRAELEEVRRHRKQYRSHRRGEGLPVVSLVGYTNAGKSTLLNSLTDAAVLTTGELFATLDPVTRRLALPGGKMALLTDTVGFIQNLPIQLVAAFRATLEEITESDLILHVVDITHRNVRQQVTTVEQVLTEIGASGKPLLVALNKADLLIDPRKAKEIAAGYDSSVVISALQRWGLEELCDSMVRMLAEAMTSVRVHIPYAASDLVALFHEFGVVVHEEHDGTGIAIHGRLPAELAARYTRFLAD